MFVAAVGLAVTGSIVLAGLRPDGAGAYWRILTGDGAERAAMVTSHHLLLLPNQSVLLLTAAMGGCDISRRAGSDSDLLCFGRQPIVQELAKLGIGRSPAGGDGMPAAYYLFVLVPAAAVLEGGRFARSIDGKGHRWRGAIGAGVVFAALFTLASLAATISITASPALAQFGVFPLSVGPELPAAAAFALAWGIAGGAIGALLLELQPAEPPSPTSV